MIVIIIIVIINHAIKFFRHYFNKLRVEISTEMTKMRDGDQNYIPFLPSPATVMEDERHQKGHISHE